MIQYIKPSNTYEQSSTFTCPHCGVLATHIRSGNCLSPQVTVIPHNFHQYQHGLFKLVCSGCNGETIFFKSQLIYPKATVGPMPIDGMPDEVRKDYEEARRVVEDSPRSAAALLRVSVQKLCKHLGEKGENINDDIGSLVAKGLSVQIQQALDVVRVVGNNAVHPGQIDLNDNPEVCSALFGIVNVIVERMIVEPARTKEIFSSLPQSSLEAIEKRDTPKPPKR